MKFTVNTKPLIDALDLGVINQNVSKFFKKSCLAQISATKSELRLNFEASKICSEVRLKGSGDSEESAIVFVDCLLLKQLVGTFESSTTTLDFTESSLVLHSGKAQFTLPKMVDGSDLALTSPVMPEDGSAEVDVDKSTWKFIKDYQMYAIAMSFIHPVYTKVWIGADGDVLVGDFDNSLFTHSRGHKFGKTCLVVDTIVNLFNSLPDGAKMLCAGDNYIIHVKTDALEYIAEFTPEYESDEGVGSYNSDIILQMMQTDDSLAVKATSAVLSKYLSQASLLSKSVDDVIKFTVADSVIRLQDKNVDCTVDVEGSSDEAYSLRFKIEHLRSVLAHYEDGPISVMAMKQDGQVVGIVIYNDKLVTVLAGVDD